jgi:sec-independent protein translocase protein TatA
MRPPSPIEILLIIAIVIVIFGAGKLPQVTEFIGKGAGKVASFFKSKAGHSDSQSDDQSQVTKKRRVIKKLE